MRVDKVVTTPLNMRIILDMAARVDQDGNRIGVISSELVGMVLTTTGGHLSQPRIVKLLRSMENAGFLRSETKKIGFGMGRPPLVFFPAQRRVEGEV